MLKELILLTAVIPLFLFLSTFFPQTHGIFLVLWLFCLGFDVYSTYLFYLEDPSRFQQNEQNKIFSYLTKKAGFKKAAIIFPIAIEIPLLLFFSLLPLQALYTYMFPHTSNNLLIICFAASLGISAIGHLQAATKNMYYTHKTRKQQHP
ncbi:MAG: hypothetical protein FWC33_02205 [Candidatus Bathyarchaeota archaeon]|nr:hypothetical protein [Candidatus Termiticorpusculum sp.]